MSISRLTKRVEAMGSAWEQFKGINDRRLHEIERKGSADPLTIEQLGKINNVIDGYKERLSSVETAISRPSVGGDFGSALTPVMSEHKEAFCGYLRKGVEDDLAFLEKKALSVGSDPDGGYLVTPNMSDRIIKSVFETSPMRQIAAVERISSDSLEIIDEATEEIGRAHV